MANSPFTVKQLLELPTFEGAAVMSGSEGLENEIYFVNSMEIPDLSGWLRPNELICTTGYSVRHEPAMICRLLDEMHRVGGSAIAIKTKRFLQSLPEEALEKSERYRIPLIDVPVDKVWTDLFYSVMETIVNRQAAVLREVQEVSQQFTNLVLNRRSTELVLLIGKLLQCESAVINQDGVVESCTPGFTREGIAKERAIQVGSRVLGYLVITREPDDQDGFAHMCLDQAVTVLAIELTIRQSMEIQREREQEAFLIDLFSGTSGQEDLLRYRAKQLGIPHGLHQYVMVIRPQSPGESEAQKRDLLEGLLMDIRKQGKFTRMGVLVNDEIAVICVTTQSSVAGQREETARFLQKWSQVHCGIGSIRERLVDLRESYQEAKRALDIGKRVKPQQSTIHFHDVLVEDMLQDVADHPSLTALTGMLIEPLAHYDKEYGTELLPTLEVFLRSGGNTKRVAEELYIHRNSVLYRLERIREILNIDWNEAETRSRLDLVMRAWKMKRAAGKLGL